MRPQQHITSGRDHGEIWAAENGVIAPVDTDGFFKEWRTVGNNGDVHLIGSAPAPLIQAESKSAPESRSGPGGNPEANADCASSSGPQAGTGRQLRLRKASKIKDDAPTWAWETDGRGRMMLSTVGLLAGRPGAGKATCARWMTAGFTNGTMPGHFFGKPQNVAYVTTEESWQYIIKPGLRAAGADMDRVFEISVQTEDGKETRLLAQDDEIQMTQQFIDNDISIVVVDPLMSTINGKTDIYRNNETREVLDPWVRIAEKINGLVIGISHLVKAANGDVVAAIQGSSAFGELARSIFGLVQDDEGKRVMSQEKNSTGTTDFAVEYDLVEVEVTTDSGRAAKVARFEITGDSDRTSADVLRENASPTRSKSKGETVLWLGQFLADGPKHSKIGTLRGFRHRGWSKDQFKKNRRAAGVVSKKCGDHWFWMTAEQKLQIEMGAPAPEVTPEELEEIRLAEEEGLGL